MKIRTQSGALEELGQGQTFTVKFTDFNARGPYGYADGYKVLPNIELFDLHRGETWEVEEVVRWGGRHSAKSNGQGGPVEAGAPCIYALPVRMLSG